MNKHKFVQYLRSPKELDRGALIELESIVEEYPYFQSARTLLAKAGKNLKSKKAKLYVSSAAVYATDRGLLKRYINDELIFLNPLTVHESHEAELERDLTKAVKSNKLATSRNKKPSEKEKPKTKNLKISNRPKKAKDGYLTMDDLKTETPSGLDDMIAELYKDMEELKVNREKLKTIEDQLEEDEAVDEALKKVASKAEEEQETEEQQETEGIESKEESTDVEIEDKPEVNPESNSEEEKDTPDDPDEAPTSTREKEPIKKASESRSARISSIDSEVEISKSLTGARKSETEEDESKEEPEENKDESDSGQQQENEATATDDVDQTESEPKAQKDSPKKEQSQIIDDFIKNNPSITPVAKDNKDFNQSDLSWTSGDLHPDIASEYLAEIYLEQGHKDRALQILEALIVRFPEKSFYFADIIKKINEKE